MADSTRMTLSSTHPCPIGLVRPRSGAALVVDHSWCFDAWTDRLRSLDADLPESCWPPSGWTLYQDATREIVYAPFDWTNESARVVLVGITPGRHQGWVASMEAAAALRRGASADEALRRAKSVGSFSGPMRRNLVTMLDQIGLAETLGIASCDELFGSAHHLASHMSALAFPVFINGRNYTGSNITRDPVFLTLIRQVLLAQLLQAAQALIVPLGNAAADAVGLLIEDGVIDPARCLLGFPHPSGANGHRLAQFESRRAELATEVSRWLRAYPGRQALVV
jgi:hypothetical protein